MNVYFEIFMNEISLNNEKTFYNNLFWDMKPNKYGITGILEKYDDVDEHTALYTFYKGETQLCIGEGCGIQEDKIGYGGVSVMVHLFYVESFFK